METMEVSKISSSRLFSFRKTFFEADLLFLFFCRKYAGDGRERLLFMGLVKGKKRCIDSWDRVGQVFLLARRWDVLSKSSSYLFLGVLFPLVGKPLVLMLRSFNMMLFGLLAEDLQWNHIVLFTFNCLSWS